MNKFKNLQYINGYEIIDFLNSIDTDDDDDWCDVCLNKPYTFEEQIISDSEYKLTFSGNFNNWSTYQLVKGNVITINTDGLISVTLEEPCWGCGDEQIFLDTLTKWLETHLFNPHIKLTFDKLIMKTKLDLNLVEYNDIDTLNKIINQLITAKSYCKNESI